MKIISFDIEEWFIEKEFGGNRKDKYVEYDIFLDKILEMLHATGKKATFFCVGKMAIEFPEVLRRIDVAGHEIGCHSNVHTWLNKMSTDEALEDTHQAVDSLEQCIGKKVLSYRAPAFSIGENNPWAFEILAKCGIERDSSVFPASRDFGGFPNFGSNVPTIVTYKGINIKEFPISTTILFGKDVAYCGGGYFRFFPYWFIKKEMNKYPFSICYFHIGDLLPETNGVMSKEAYEEYFKENGTVVNRYKRYFKSNYGKKGAWKKLERLVRTYDFTNLDLADKSINWTKCPQKEL